MKNIGEGLSGKFQVIATVNRSKLLSDAVILWATASPNGMVAISGNNRYLDGK
ncbi:MAG: hypothetical protein LBT43_02185 [Prevotella sp.]|nr:hypothetical protein [Prevotella sp.]